MVEDLEMRADARAASVDDRTAILALSKSRAHDFALEFRRAYKLTGNFHVNLEILLEHLDAQREVAFEVEPKSWLSRYPDCRRVEFRANGSIQHDRFVEVLTSIEKRIGFIVKQPWWETCLRRVTRLNVRSRRRLHRHA